MLIWYFQPLALWVYCFQTRTLAAAPGNSSTMPWSLTTRSLHLVTVLGSGSKQSYLVLCSTSRTIVVGTLVQVCLSEWNERLGNLESSDKELEGVQSKKWATEWARALPRLMKTQLPSSEGLLGVNSSSMPSSGLKKRSKFCLLLLFSVPPPFYLIKFEWREKNNNSFLKY